MTNVCAQTARGHLATPNRAFFVLFLQHFIRISAPLIKAAWSNVAEQT